MQVRNNEGLTYTVSHLNSRISNLLWVNEPDRVS